MGGFSEYFLKRKLKKLGYVHTLISAITSRDELLHEGSDVDLSTSTLAYTSIALHCTDNSSPTSIVHHRYHVGTGQPTDLVRLHPFPLALVRGGGIQVGGDLVIILCAS